MGASVPLQAAMDGTVSDPPDTTGGVNLSEGETSSVEIIIIN
jgi:hypothetical protein